MLLISDIDFKDIYVTDEASSVQENRYKNAVGKFKEYFNGKEPSSIFSAPGRTEVGGNHTDHQHGEVLAASINKDAIAVTALREDNTVNIFAEGFGNTVIGIDDLSLREDEKGYHRRIDPYNLASGEDPEDRRRDRRYRRRTGHKAWQGRGDPSSDHRNGFGSRCLLDAHK